MSLTLRCPEEADTRAVGRRLASLLRAGDVVLLTGDLGAGKTVFASGIAEGLGVAEQVVSPSFILARRYAGPAVGLADTAYLAANPELIIARRYAGPAVGLVDTEHQVLPRNPHDHPAPGMTHARLQRGGQHVPQFRRPPLEEPPYLALVETVAKVLQLIFESCCHG